MRFLTTSFGLLSCCLLLPGIVSSLATPEVKIAAPRCEPWTVDAPDRVFILTDIANEPDDTMSLVRLLTHADTVRVEGIVAITSFWLPNATHPEQIHSLVDTYASVYSNLQSHSPGHGFPTPSYLHSVIASGPKTYGLQAINSSSQPLSEGAKLLISAVDRSSEPLYIQMWGGANTLAEALSYLSQTISPTQLSTFTSKLRVYSISDQDDAGPWLRAHFPSIRWIASRHAFNRYALSAWVGMSSPYIDVGGPNQSLVSDDWIRDNVQSVGPLGAEYPDVEFIMEGDTPAFLFNVQNGLGDAEVPSRGGWGGRYAGISLRGDETQFADVPDQVIGADGKTYNSNKASVWRWRDAVQSEFAARMQWTLGEWSGVGDGEQRGNTTHPPVVVLNGSCGFKALELNVQVGEKVVLDAGESYSLDGPDAELNFTWFQDREATFSAGALPLVNITAVEGSARRMVELAIPEPSDGFCVLAEDVTEFGQWGERSKCPVLHVVLAVKDIGAKFPMTRYRRVVLNVQPWRKS
ncbi:DUF1593-domain-containing protein [Aaosphaeria arxii CBS 175.79]|uniref:DUF1593-domain-containing protein n=1 Tax=Aaosphaeria arxii CBS 175.79 TaxID=1450172 RepID=A0A6A5Y2T1_9PLEO|nr:DUF1593-domain-containing protein [Aaosphaeria arxii CBS 175.79]KAF2019852.1 DUF1593-domain-containing protein [Aaosphaeria arxii CBS 175.79]